MTRFKHSNNLKDTEQSNKALTVNLTLETNEVLVDYIYALTFHIDMALIRNPRSSISKTLNPVHVCHMECTCIKMAYRCFVVSSVIFVLNGFIYLSRVIIRSDVF